MLYDSPAALEHPHVTPNYTRLVSLCGGQIERRLVLTRASTGDARSAIRQISQAGNAVLYSSLVLQLNGHAAMDPAVLFVIGP